MKQSEEKGALGEPSLLSKRQDVGPTQQFH